MLIPSIDDLGFGPKADITSFTRSTCFVAKENPVRPSEFRPPIAPFPVVNSVQLALDAESGDPLRDVGSLQNNFWDCRRFVPTARDVGSRDPGVAAADHRAATR